MKLLRVNPIEQLGQNIFSGVHAQKIPAETPTEAQIDHTPPSLVDL
jgi:hypothetical protein